VFFNLSQMSFQAKRAAVPVLTAALKDKDATVRLQILQVLADTKAIDPAQANAVLTEAFKDPQLQVRMLAVQTAGRLGTQVKEIIPAVARLVRDPEQAVRTQVMRLLARLPAALAETAVPALLEALKDQETFVRQQAAQALRQMKQIDPK